MIYPVKGHSTTKIILRALQYHVTGIMVWLKTHCNNFTSFNINPFLFDATYLEITHHIFIGVGYTVNVAYDRERLFIENISTAFIYLLCKSPELILVFLYGIPV